MHGFFGADGAGAGERTEGAGDLIMELGAVVTEHKFADAAFPVDDPEDDILDFGDEVGFGFSERDLIGDLVEVAESLAAFAVESADGEVDFLSGLVDFLNFAGDAEGGEVQHHAEADSGPGIGGAGGEVTELWVEGEGDGGFDVIIELIAGLPAFVESKAAVEHLNAKVIFFVDHDAVSFAV